MAAVADPGSSEWGTCRFCGVAVAPGATKCGICGAEHPLSAAEAPNAPRRVRRWVRLTHAFRILVVVTVVVGLTYAILSAVLSGPPNLSSDPLSTNGTYKIGPGNYTVISGEITAGDYVTGNFTAVDPVGVNIAVAVYNTTEWNQFVGGESPAPLYSVTPTYQASLVYSPLVTDNYYFVFTNPYPVASHLTIGVYIATLYNANVANDGFA
ncbi:MAG TPA: hypothetical protein VEG42_02690 [Thermoplasmata archaeon]|nr:hypothetical protein [Thermoplasmata archaeon]